MTSVLVTQSFGQQSEYRRAIFMIWSYWAHALASSKVILFTDKPDFFEPYFSGQPIEYILLTPEKIKIMRGNIDFLHRMKIALIEEAFSKSPDTNLLYADSDTFFTADPSFLAEKLTPNLAFMHTREYAFEEIRNMPLPAGKSFQAFVALLDNSVFSQSDGSPIKITTDSASWNAGVMFFHPSHSALLSDVYTLTDQFYPTTRNHASEQYAFSIVMQNKTMLYACEEVIYHYWYRVKKEIVDLFFERNLGQLLTFSLEEKIVWVSKWTNDLPAEFDKNVLMLRDRAIQTFHENKFKEGYGFTVRAIIKNPFSFTFLKDVAYHTKRLATGAAKRK